MGGRHLRRQRREVARRPAVLGVRNQVEAGWVGTRSSAGFSWVTTPPGWNSEAMMQIASATAMPIRTARVAMAKSFGMAAWIFAMMAAGAPFDPGAAEPSVLLLAAAAAAAPA